MTKNQSLYVVLAAIIALLVGEFMGYHFTTPAELIIQNYPLDLSWAGAHIHHQFNVSIEDAPYLDLVVTADHNMGGDYLVHIITENFQFAPQNASREHVLGQGHAHIFVDDVKLGRVYSEWYYLPKLKSGSHTILVSLSTNDHWEYAVDGRTIERSVKVNIMDEMPCHQMPDGTMMGNC